MTKIVLTRHGEVEGIKPERFRGRADLALTERGEAQARLLGQRITAGWRPSFVYTSPARRCIATGAAIASVCGVEAGVLEELTDIDYGSWQLKSHEGVRQSDPEAFAAWFATPHLFRFPNGDSLQDLVARTSEALRLVLARHPAETVVAVGHESVNRALLLQLLDQPLSSYWRIVQHPCCVNEIDVTKGKVRVIRINETHHLTGATID
jgi:broad specificity phosphatase PhoE